ncbi:DUF748 domain-containing protein [Noviherbaspirillum massiliense]|uniref:DUF748 domain-containing protein n=1 Tax=Noviherbaspirillum massiliense TaxID=1465823 RepID=UPI00030EB09F|nr:DUF748 domain-containing protein [Noviherbaspirillum massiliense]
MKNITLGRKARLGLAALGIIIVISSAGMHFAAKSLKTQVEQALGEESAVGSMSVGFSSIELRDVVIRAPKGWPAQDTLRAERVVIKPDLLGLATAKIRVARITVEQPYLSVLRTRDGRLRLLPSLLERKKPAGGKSSSAPEVGIGSVELHGGVLEFFDASVKQPAHKLRLEQLEASVEDLHVPDLASRTRLQIAGVVKGAQRNGRLSIDGWAEIATRDSEVTTRLSGVDLTAFEPYLIKASETGVRKGTLDMQIKSTVRHNQLRAPGNLSLTGLELSAGGGALGTFMGVPRQAVIASLRDRDNRISIDFTLEGNLNDPKFSLNESFARRIGASIADSLGVSLEGLTRGVGSAAGGLGGAVLKMFGK